MIYYEYIDPADAKPGDFMLLRNNEGGYFDLKICLKFQKSYWTTICLLCDSSFPNENIDGKPTPALIARFTGNNGKRFEAPDCTLIYRDGVIFEVGHVRIYNLNRKSSFYLSSDKIDTNSSFKEFNYESEEQAETERARLIEWLEKA